MDDKERGNVERGVDAFINQADKLCRAGKQAEAVKCLDRALKMCQKKLGPDHPKTALAMTKRNVAPRIQSSGPTNPQLHFDFFDHSSEEQAYRANFEICRIIRRHVYLEELKVQSEAEYDAFDVASRHVIAMIGDAPVGYVRWRIEATEQGSYALVDRLCTLTSYRQRGFARKAIEAVVADVSHAVSQGRVLAVMAIVVVVPAEAGIFHQKLQQASFVPMEGVFQDRGIACVRMALQNSAEAQAGAQGGVQMASAAPQPQ